MHAVLAFYERKIKASAIRKACGFGLPSLGWSTNMSMSMLWDLRASLANGGVKVTQICLPALESLCEARTLSQKQSRAIFLFYYILPFAPPLFVFCVFGL